MSGDIRRSHTQAKKKVEIAGRQELFFARSGRKRKISGHLAS
jgi:hypothetical protein